MQLGAVNMCVYLVRYSSYSYWYNLPQKAIHMCFSLFIDSHVKFALKPVTFSRVKCAPSNKHVTKWVKKTSRKGWRSVPLQWVQMATASTTDQARRRHSGKSPYRLCSADPLSVILVLSLSRRWREYHNHRQNLYAVLASLHYFDRTSSDPHHEGGQNDSHCRVWQSPLHTQPSCPRAQWGKPVRSLSPMEALRHAHHRSESGTLIPRELYCRINDTGGDDTRTGFKRTQKTKKVKRHRVQRPWRRWGCDLSFSCT